MYNNRRVFFLKAICLINIAFQLLLAVFNFGQPVYLQALFLANIPLVCFALFLLDRHSKLELASSVFIAANFFQFTLSSIVFSTGQIYDAGSLAMVAVLCLIASVLLGIRWGIGFTLLGSMLACGLYFPKDLFVLFPSFHLSEQNELYQIVSLLEAIVLANYVIYYSFHAIELEVNDKREIKQRLEKVLDCAIQSIVLIDRDRKIIYSDAKTKQLAKLYLNIDLTDGDLAEKYIPMPLRETFDINLDKALAGEKMTVERRVDLIPNRPLWFFVMYTPLLDSYGKIDSVLFSLIEITEQKNIQNELEKAEQRWKYALTSSQDGVWDWNMKDGTVYYSKMWKMMLGYEEHEVENAFAGWERLVHPDDKENAFAEIVKHVKGQTDNYSLEHRLRAKDGQYKWILTRGKVIDRDSEGNPVRFIGTHTDINHNKVIEQELKAAQESAEQATEAKSIFLSTISHEIRTPLNAVIGFSNLLLRENQDPRNFEYLESIQTSANHLLSLVNNVLDLSKIESGKLEFEKREFELEKLVDENISMLSLRAKEKNIELLAGKIPVFQQHLMGDQLRLTQVLNNLLGNAVKFTNKGFVRLDIEVVYEQSDAVELKFSIQDSGTGIPVSKQDSIFDSFSQASTDTTRKYGGTGLGLTISKHIINLQGGNIGIKSKVGEGSTFYFNLKFQFGKTIKRRAVKPTEEKETPLKGLKVLVAEDNIFNTKVVTRFLEFWQIDYDVAEDGLQVLEKIAESDFDLVLMDLHMPKMDGYQATQKIKEMNREVQVIALTASASIGSKEEMTEKGFDDFAVKPINPKELYKKLSEIHQSLAKVRD
jgi:PAS domain S-box-containing protein